MKSQEFRQQFNDLNEALESYFESLCQGRHSIPLTVTDAMKPEIDLYTEGNDVRPVEVDVEEVHSQLYVTIIALDEIEDVHCKYDFADFSFLDRLLILEAVEQVLESLNN